MPSETDWMGNVKFVLLTTVPDLPLAEALKKLLWDEGVGAVVINDEEYQARPDSERAQAVPKGEGFRIEVPEPLYEKARAILEKKEREDGA